MKNALTDTLSNLANVITKRGGERESMEVPNVSVRYVKVLSQTAGGICTVQEAGDTATYEARSLTGPISANTTCLALRYGSELVVLGKLYGT